ncbi:MAG: DUF1592 domain-containing protein, partial [Myxococcales bacterium]|nr:DUF1592 domain-containing protein [Myxococcales bacterium]
MLASLRLRGVLLVALWLPWGCTADPGAPAGPVDGGVFEPASCDVTDPGPAPVRRLRVVEYDNILADLLGDETKPGTRFLTTETRQGDSRLADELLAEEHLRAAEDVAKRAAEDPKELMGCDPTTSSFGECAEGFLEDLARRAFRRPLSKEEKTALFLSYSTWKRDWGTAMAVEMSVGRILMSPHFLYRIELVDDSADGGERVPLDDYEMASRLSFFLWETMPDDELFEAAEKGELRTRDGVAMHAARMLEDPRSDAMLQNFHANWLSLGALDGLVKDSEIFPDFSPEIATLLREQTELFIKDVFRDGDGRWASLLTSDTFFVNDTLAEFYGIDGTFSDGFEPVSLPADRPLGVFSQGAFPAIHARGDGTSPVRRGIFMLGKVLCGAVPDVPP